MKRYIFAVILLVLGSVGVSAQQHDVTIDCSWGALSATMAAPSEGSDTAVLIIAGSGPTDRNGNSGLNLNTYAYKMLSDALVEHGYAVLRYDKRGVGASYLPVDQVADLLYDDYVDDAARCVEWLREQGYARIFLAGHSEGGGIAIEVAQFDDVDGLVLLAAPGYPIDEVLLWQLSQQLVPAYMGLYVRAERIVRILKSGGSVALEDVPNELLSLFHPSVQPFLRSSMQRVPCDMIAECSEPVLIITGGRDIQVTVDNGERLLAAAHDACHVTFEQMSHVLKDASTSDRMEQVLSVYTNSQQPLTEGLVSTIVDFINSVSNK